MKTYEVLDYNFQHVGYVTALTPVAALHAAKARWRFVIGVMVEEVAATAIQ